MLRITDEHVRDEGEITEIKLPDETPFPRNTTATKLCYFRLNTELKLPEVFEMIRSVEIVEGKEDRGTVREITGIQWNILLLLKGMQVKHSKSEEAFYMPLYMVAGRDSILRIHWDEKLLAKEEKRAKLRVGKKPSLLVIKGQCGMCMAALGWVPSPPRECLQLHVTEKETSFVLSNLPMNRKIAQIVFYGHVSAQSWLKKGVLRNTAGTVLAEFQEPYEATVFDREIKGLPGSTSPIFTFTFENYLEHSTAESDQALILQDGPPTLSFVLDPQFMPQNPVIQVWCISSAVV